MASKKVCHICNLGEDLLNLGELRSHGGCSIHIYCGLFSYNLPQRGEDDEDIEGFLVCDIKQFLDLHKKMQCYYCKGTFPTVKCASQNCFRKFHVKCGMNKKCLFQFTDGKKHHAYCDRHVEIQEKFGIRIHDDWWKCQICKEEMGPYHPITSIPSCCNRGFFHRTCAQLHARSAGYLTKCPCCGDADDEDGNNYRNFLSLRGIFCPNKDADWELCRDAYSSLLNIYQRCDATKCLCPKGREHGSARGEWYLLKCRYCGENCVHKGCRQRDDKEEFQCDDCNVKAAGSSLVTENSTNDAKNTNEIAIDDGDADENKRDDVNPLSSKTRINNDKNNRKRKRQSKPELEPEPKVLVLRRTNQLRYRKSALVLVDPSDINADQSTNVDPFCDEERSKMRADRMDMFWRKFQHDAKPPPLPWLI